MPDPLARLVYVDDSGRQRSGLIVYGWMQFTPSSWPVVLRRWLELRKQLYREYGIDVEKELHSTEYINGRGRVTTRPPDRHIHNGVTYWKDLGQEIARVLLTEISSLEGVTVGAVYRRHDPNPTVVDKVEVYRELVHQREEELAARAEYAMVFVDGNGSDPSYRTAHRGLKLDSRRILEDPIMTDSATSQLVQIADLIAWCAYVAIENHSSHAFASGWYDEFLAIRDPFRAPREL